MTHGQSDMASVLGQESSLLQLPRRQQSDKQYVNYLAQSMASFFFFFFNKVKVLKQGQAQFSSQHLALAHLALGLDPSSISLCVAVSGSVQSL